MFEKILEKQFPRILSQACRDVNAPFYGSFDRNWWHYRIRDFSSIILQQGGYCAYLYGELEGYSKYKGQLCELARASALFWNKRASRNGAFEEYYPREKGYPPLAFSTLAVAKLAAKEVVLPEDIMVGLRKAARQLQNRFENQAGNQQVAGLAALSVIRKIQPELVKDSKFKALKKNTLELQTGSGWFTEYDGPDLGYLSVTLDCLFDLHDNTGDADYLKSAEKALGFMHEFILRRGQSAGMHNARNTDYLVPYGICRFLEHEEEKYRIMAEDVIAVVYDRIDSEEHFIYAIDDRYWIHYFGHSIVRAEKLLARIGKEKFKMGSQPEPEYQFEDSGYIFRKLSKSDSSILVSGYKGGIFTIFKEGKTLVADYGWIARKGKLQYVNHWWSKSWFFKNEDDGILIEGNLFPHKEKVSTPCLHSGLRAVSFLFGKNITGILRNVLIYKSKSSNIRFVRKIALAEDSVIVTDRIEGLSKKANLSRAPRASKRHVASAGSWHEEDFVMNAGVDPMETIIREGTTAVITSIFTL